MKIDVYIVTIVIRLAAGRMMAGACQHWRHQTVTLSTWRPTRMRQTMIRSLGYYRPTVAGAGGGGGGPTVGWVSEWVSECAIACDWYQPSSQTASHVCPRNHDNDTWWELPSSMHCSQLCPPIDRLCDESFINTERPTNMKRSQTKGWYLLTKVSGDCIKMIYCSLSQTPAAINNDYCHGTAAIVM